MRRALVALLLGLVWNVAVEITAVEMPEHLKGPRRIVRTTCQEKTNVSEELIERNKNGYFPEDNRALKCYIECIYRTVGLYDEGGNIVYDELYHILSDYLKERVEFVASKCNTIHGSDPCETAWLTTKCYYEVDPDNPILP